jgi:hypothetical protein
VLTIGELTTARDPETLTITARALASRSGSLCRSSLAYGTTIEAQATTHPIGANHLGATRSTTTATGNDLPRSVCLREDESNRGPRQAEQTRMSPIGNTTMTAVSEYEMVLATRSYAPGRAFTGCAANGIAGIAALAGRGTRLTLEPADRCRCSTRDRYVVGRAGDFPLLAIGDWHQAIGNEPVDRPAIQQFEEIPEIYACG